jgi:hypothetical protein
MWSSLIDEMENIGWISKALNFLVLVIVVGVIT